MMPEPRGRTSRCKASIRGLWCMEWKDSITGAHAKSCGSLTNSKSKRWPQSADRGRKNHFLKNCKAAKILMTGENFPRAFSKGRSSLAQNGPSHSREKKDVTSM